MTPDPRFIPNSSDAQHLKKAPLLRLNLFFWPPSSGDRGRQATAPGNDQVLLRWRHPGRWNALETWQKRECACSRATPPSVELGRPHRSERTSAFGRQHKRGCTAPWRGPASQSERAAGGAPQPRTQASGRGPRRACRREQGARDGVPHVCDTYAACPRGLGQPVASTVAAVALGFGRRHASGLPARDGRIRGNARAPRGDRFTPQAIMSVSQPPDFRSL